MTNDKVEVAPRTTVVAWPVVHGTLLLVLVLVAQRLPMEMHWPLHLLIPLLVYALVVVAVGPLRRTCTWLKTGRIDRIAAAVTVAIVVATSLALASYQAVVRPNVDLLRAELPRIVLGSVVLAGVYFAVLNAVMEEAVFRGALYEALESSWGCVPAIAISSAAFGAAHAAGYPQGVLGGVMAGVYGLSLGWIRWKTGGLAAPTIAHVFADATIFGMLAG